jgi:hypothetical protein
MSCVHEFRGRFGPAIVVAREWRSPKLSFKVVEKRKDALKDEGIGSGQDGQIAALFAHKPQADRY